MSVFIAESELGMPETSLYSLREMVSQLPFEGAALHIATLQGRIEAVLTDPAGQRGLAQEFFGGRHELLARYAAVFRRQPSRTVFSPQPIMLLQRLLIEHARDVPLRDLTSAEFRVIQDAVLGAHSAAEVSLDSLPEASRDHLLAYELQASTFFRRPPLLEEMARHREFLRLMVADPRLADSANRVDVDALLSVDGADAERQLTVGLALAAMSNAFANPVHPRVMRGHIVKLLAEIGSTVLSPDLPMIATSRDGYREAFALLDGGDSELSWEQRPFKARPFLRLTTGDLLLLAPPWLLSWLGEGFHYRAMSRAQTSEGTAASAMYTRYVGEVVERYALDLAEAATSPPTKVFGEQAYGKGGGGKTSDVTILIGRDLFVFEIHARRVAANAAVTGTAQDATLEVSRLLVKKIDQLGLSLAALLAGRVHLPGVHLTNVDRIWPVVVANGYLMQTGDLWAYLDESVDHDKSAALAAPKVQPLQVLDMTDYEKVLSLVEAGEDLAAMFAQKAGGPFWRRDFAAWLNDDPAAPSSEARLAVIQDRWRDIGEELRRAFETVAQGDGDAHE
jgi:hypothetical protein